MGILGTDYILRSGHLLLLLLTASSVILGFSYLNEMYQKIQIQQDMVIVERQTQHIVAERSIIQRKATLLQTQIENKNKEMKRMQDLHEFQIQQQSTNFEKEKDDLLENISLKDDEITDIQNQYDSLNQRFDDLRSVMAQFEKNQSRLLEKFSTQSTQCMNVINMMSELCNKGKDNKLRKIPQFTKQKDTLINGVTIQSITLINQTKDISLVPYPEDAFKRTQKPGTERYVTLQITDGKILESDEKQSSLIAKQELQTLGSEPKNTTNTGDDQEDVTAQEKMYSPEEEKVLTTQNIESQVFGNNYYMASENDLKEKSLLNEILHLKNNTSIGQKQSIQQPRINKEKQKKLLALDPALESDRINLIKAGKLNNSQYINESEVTALKNRSLQLTSKSNKIANREMFIKEDVAAEKNTKTEVRDKTLKGHVKSRKSTLDKIKTSDDKIEGNDKEENKKQDVALDDKTLW